MRTQKQHVPKAQMTAAIWCRVSSEKQAADEKSSLSTQERYCRDEVKRLGAVVDEAHALLLPESASEPEARNMFEWLMREADRQLRQADVEPARGHAFTQRTLQRARVLALQIGLDPCGVSVPRLPQQQAALEPCSGNHTPRETCRTVQDLLPVI